MPFLNADPLVLVRRMSVDLYIIREQPLTWAETLRALDEVALENEGLRHWTMTQGEDTFYGEASTNAYFWQARRVSLTIHARAPFDELHDDPVEFTKPIVVMNANSGSWPCLEWLTITLAERLGARVYDPQSGEIYSAGPPENNFAMLKATHESWIAEQKPTLVSNCWAVDVGEPSFEGLRAQVGKINAVASEVLGTDASVVLSGGKQPINLSHTFPLADEKLVVSSFVETGLEGRLRRTLHVYGPAANTRVHAFAEALGAQLGVRFRSVDEYM